MRHCTPGDEEEERGCSGMCKCKHGEVAKIGSCIARLPGVCGKRRAVRWHGGH